MLYFYKLRKKNEIQNKVKIQDFSENFLAVKHECYRSHVISSVEI